MRISRKVYTWPHLISRQRLFRNHRIHSCLPFSTQFSPYHDDYEDRRDYKYDCLQDIYKIIPPID